MRFLAGVGLLLALAAPPAALAQAPSPPPPPVLQAPGDTPDSPPRTIGPPVPLGALPVPAPGESLRAALDRGDHSPSASFARGISDGRTFVLGASSLADDGLARLPELGTRIVRLPLFWGRTERNPPANARDPADPAYDWRGYDRLVKAAVGNGLEVLSVPLEAPARAEAPGRWEYARAGTWAPDPEAFGAFVEAAARRYSGRFPDPSAPGAVLPRIARWQLWNEPNLPRYLSPQWTVRDGRWVPYAPARYRALLNAGQRALKAVDPTNVVITAGTAPIGEPRDGEGRMSPVRFWQAMLCLGAPPRLSAQPCADPARFDLWAHHPLSVGDPTRVSRGAEEVGIADLGRLRRITRAAQARGLTVPRSGQQLAITELNWDSAPDVPQGVPAARLARYVSSGLELLERQGAALVVYQFLRDAGEREDRRLHPAGLYRIDPARPGSLAGDRPKSAARAWRLPFVARRVSERRVSLWGMVPGKDVERVSIDIRTGKRWRRFRTVEMPGEVLRTRVALHGRAQLRLRVGSLRRSRDQTSAAWTVGPRRDPLAPRPSRGR